MGTDRANYVQLSQSLVNAGWQIEDAFATQQFYDGHSVNGYQNVIVHKASTSKVWFGEHANHAYQIGYLLILSKSTGL
jgi:hypothetical protein